MDETELGDRLKAAFEPFLRGFCKEPTLAAVSITVQLDRIDADAVLGSTDLQTIAADVHVAKPLKEAFGALCRQNDLTRGSSLVFRARTI